jgi:hypothetical protein
MAEQTIRPTIVVGQGSGDFFPAETCGELFEHSDFRKSTILIICP